MTNWRTSLAGGFGALSTYIIGGGVLTLLVPGEGVPPDIKRIAWYVTAFGYLCSGLSKFFAGMASADAKSVKEMMTQVNQNSAAIISGDTSEVKKGT
jgi:hypothetical protein